MTDSGSRDVDDGNEPRTNDPLRVGSGLIEGGEGAERSVTSAGKIDQDAAEQEHEHHPEAPRPKPGPGLAAPGLGIHVME